MLTNLMCHTVALMINSMPIGIGYEIDMLWEVAGYKKLYILQRLII